jgi:signal peptidase I
MGSPKTNENRKKARQHARRGESFLETLEQIAMAFVLALLVQAFVVQAFVIPTGSMGPTLHGAHYEFACPDCGYKFSAGGDIPLDNAAVCPNCFLALNEASAAYAAGGRGPPYGGDRILALRFIYDFEQPERWDVIVFRNPTNPEENYIKRLVALPGESIQVVRGDVWINGEISSKTDAAQAALWQIVHDTRYRPSRTGWQPRWIAEDGWTPRGAGFVLGEPADGAKAAWLSYRHRDADGRPANIRDFCAYNTGTGGKSPAMFGASVVTDLALKASVKVDQPQAVVIIEMRAWKDRFRFELTAEGGSRPSRILRNGQVVGESPGGALPVGKTVEIQAANVDHKLMLLVGGRRVTVTQGPSTVEGDARYEPSAASLEAMRRLEESVTSERISLQRELTGAERTRVEESVAGGPGEMLTEVRLGAEGAAAEVQWLRIDRDVYYTSEDMVRSNGTPPTAVKAPFALEANEFFVLGDNSPRSLDARLWVLDRPVVPRRNLIGKAFFVYLPATGPRYHLPLAPDLTGFRMIH